MLRTTLLMMAAHRGRLAAAGLAVVIGTAFVAATLLASGLIQGTLRAAVSASYAGADVVVAPAEGPVDQRVLEQVAGTAGVAAAEGRRTAYVDLVTATRTDFATVSAAPRAPALRDAAGLAGGQLPDGPGQVALDADLAGRLGLRLGDRAQVRWTTRPADASAEAAGEVRTADVTVTGLLTPRSDLTGQAPAVLGDPRDVAAWAELDAGQPVTYDRVLVVGQDGTAPQELRDALVAAVDGAVDGAGSGAVTVLTAEEQADRTADDFTGTRDLVTGVLLAFAAVAVFVAGVVVTNTLAVLVAQRRRELALLRCVGATRGQVRGSVLLEAGALGVLASLVGVALGTGLAQVATVLVGRLDLGFDTPARVSLTWATVVVPLVVGTGTTVLAALSPARAATRVPPVAALRPALAGGPGAATSRLRLAATAVLVLGGAAALGLAVLVGLSRGTGLPSIALGVLGGAVSFVGVLLGAPLLLPPVLRVLGWVVGRLGGVPARLAAANAVRNPRRTAVTASALLIGVTLVAMMTVGTASVQRTLEAELDRSYPVDITVGGDGGGVSGGLDGAGAPLDPAVLRAVAGVAAQGTVAPPLPLAGTSAELVGLDGAAVPAASQPVLGVDPVAAAGLVRDPALLEELDDRTVLVPAWLANADGTTRPARLEGPAGSADLRVVPSDLPAGALLVTAATLARLDPAAPTTRLWVDVPEGGDDAAAVRAVEDAVAGAVGSGPAAPVDGAAVQRGDVVSALDAVLAVVLGLLGVAVVIALVGVGNTLSLSVIERTRESALLRAMGLTRGQLRRTLAVEGVLLAGVGALVGVGLGVLYGWAGTVTVLGLDPAAGTVLATRLALPWERLLAVVAVALLAGLLASVLPARRAVRTPPAAALGE